MSADSELTDEELLELDALLWGNQLWRERPDGTRERVDPATVKGVHRRA